MTDVSNITVRYRRDAHVETKPVTQYNANLYLEFTSPPEGAVCAFWATASVNSLVVEGTDGVFQVPNSLLAGRDKIHAVLTVGDGSASLGVMGVAIPVIPRPKPTDYVPSTDEHVIEAGTVVTAAEAWAAKAKSYVEDAEVCVQAAKTAQAAAESAQAAAESASGKAASQADESETWATKASNYADNAKASAGVAAAVYQDTLDAASKVAEQTVAKVRTQIDTAITEADDAAGRADAAAKSATETTDAAVAKTDTAIETMQAEANTRLAAVEAAFKADETAWDGEIDALLEKGSTYETRISTLETETSDARTSYGGHAYTTVGDRISAVEHTVHAVGRSVELSLDSMSEIILAGDAEEMYPIGMQLEPTWDDPRPGNTSVWTNKFNVVDHAPATIYKDGQETQSNVLTVQQAYTLPFGTQFDPIQAFYAAPAGGLPAGNYCIEIGTTYQKVTAGDIYAFTTTVDLPEGGQLVFASSIYSYTPVQAGIRSYVSGSSSTALETLAVSKVDSTDGYTSLGKLTTGNVDYDGTLNHLHRAALGSNRWRDSALRQFLNAEGDNWFAPATKWSRPPSYVNYSGYLSGFDAEFVAHMATAVIKTCIPYCDGAASMSADVDTTYDRVFLPSAEQLYWVCTSLGCPYGAEGGAWDYWKQAYGKTSPATMWTVHEEFITYGMGAETSPRNVFERSASRNSGGYVAFCYTAGTLSSNGASYGHYCAPACYII